MRYKLFGRSGLRVSELCLGGMTFGDDWGWGAPREECKRIFDAFVEKGGNFIDTANHYTNGSSERILGELIAGDRDRFVIATKYSLSGRPDDPNSGGNHRKSLLQALEGSLERLGTDHIDIYWVHAWDPLTPIEEMMRALDDVVRSGRVLYLGISDAPAWVVSRANTLAEERAWTPFTGLQVQYSLVERTPERELLPMARALGLTVTPWSPLGAGVLTGKYNTDQTVRGTRLVQTPAGSRFLNDRNKRIAEEVVRVAQGSGRTPSQVALSWIRQQGGDMVPILGARTASQIRDDLGCLDLHLTNEQLTRLNEVSRIELGFPRDFLESDFIRFLVHGNTWDLIDR
jgi:aryl-alcohol dehydrogenase-like predicted oxidoreductase